MTKLFKLKIMIFCLLHNQIAAHMEANSYPEALKTLYIDQSMGSIEISEYLKLQYNIKISARSIQRTLRKYGLIRTAKESFNNAINRGRVQWAYKSNKIKRLSLNPKLRMEILQRDKFKCQKCGATSKDDVLEVDHINEDKNDSRPENLEILCHACNVGKYLTKEK